MHRDQVHCPHCKTAQHLLSHGFIYKKQSHGEPAVVGKRLFCANRYQRQGCGRTQRLYLSTTLPHWQYSATVLFLFLSTLIAGHTIAQAYQQATGTNNPRQAYRWLAKMMKQLSVFRSLLTGPDVMDDQPDTAGATGLLFGRRVRRLQLLLPTLQVLFSLLSDDKADACAAYQQARQQHFA